tara:strand:+ start:15806 stop:16615 length:810 start_codon:yes stop_codon:yes gene_type:complete
MSFVAAGIGLVTGGIQYFSARKDKKEAEKERAAAEAEMNKQKEAFSNLDTSNPFMNMENTMEDLTVNQQQAQFEAQQNQQNQANIMANMRQSAGGSGIAALAQTMAQQGQLATQKASASIGQQEAANQMAAAQQAASIQGKEREGEVMSRNWERDKTSTLLGMAQSDVAGARERQAAAKAAQMQALGDMAGAGMQAFSDRRLKKNIQLVGKSPSGIGIYTFEYKNKSIGEGKFQGTMSDEVPLEVVTRNSDGFDMIDYSKIDVEFKSVK